MTFGEIGVKSGIRDLVRILDLDIAIANEISELVPNKMPDQDDVTLSGLLEIAEDAEFAEKKYGDKSEGITAIAKRFKEYMLEFPEIYEPLQLLEGCVRNKGIHAGGVIICKDKISNYAPIEKGSSTAVLDIAAFDMTTCEEIGLIKMDFLGLRTLSVVAIALDLIKETTGNTIDLYAIGRHDSKVFRNIREGHTHGVFQVAGHGITKYIKEVKPTKFEELIDILALYRPGPMEALVEPDVTMVQKYIINGSISSNKYLKEVHPDLRDILESTRGVIIYQEQIMKIVQIIAGYTLGSADTLRRIIGKKKIREVSAVKWQFLYGRHAESKLDELIKTEKNKSKRDELKEQLAIVRKSPVDADGALARGYDYDMASDLYDAIGKFAGYSFNKSHSAAYADLAYQTAWLKTYYPVQFMTAQLTSQVGSGDNELDNLNEAKRIGIILLQPDINKSQSGYTIETINDQLVIRVGMAAIKGIGNSVVDIIKDIQSQHGDFKSFDDFINLVPARTVNRSYIERLIMSGVFDSIEPNRYKLLNHFFFNIRKMKEYKGTAEEYYTFKNDKTIDKSLKPSSDEYPRYDESLYNLDIRLSLEKEMIGFYLSGHPFEYLPYIPWNQINDNQEVKIGGRIVSYRKYSTKGGKDMAFMKLETQKEEIDCTLFPDTYEQYGHRLEKDALIIVKGKKKSHSDKEGLIVDKLLLPKKQKNNSIEIVSQDKSSNLPPLKIKEDPLASLFNL